MDLCNKCTSIRQSYEHKVLLTLAIRNTGVVDIRKVHTFPVYTTLCSIQCTMCSEVVQEINRQFLSRCRDEEGWRVVVREGTAVIFYRWHILHSSYLSYLLLFCCYKGFNVKSSCKVCYCILIWCFSLNGTFEIWSPTDHLLKCILIFALLYSALPLLKILGRFWCAGGPCL